MHETTSNCLIISTINNSKRDQKCLGRADITMGQKEHGWPRGGAGGIWADELDMLNVPSDVKAVHLTADVPLFGSEQRMYWAS